MCVCGRGYVRVFMNVRVRICVCICACVCVCKITVNVNSILKINIIVIGYIIFFLIYHGNWTLETSPVIIIASCCKSVIMINTSN